MAIRVQVQQLVDLGPFPASRDADADDIDHRGAIIDSITPPVTREEALALLGCFGPDEAFGLAWELIHLIETVSGGLPLETRPSSEANEWVQYLWDRSHR